MTIPEQLLVGVIFLLPPVVAGVLFLVASRSPEADGADQPLTRPPIRDAPHDD